MSIKLADLKVVPNSENENDLVYSGWVHPQIDDKSLIHVLCSNYNLQGAAEYSVIVEGAGVAGPYTFDVQPTEELESASDEEEEIFED